MGGWEGVTIHFPLHLLPGRRKISTVQLRARKVGIARPQIIISFCQLELLKISKIGVNKLKLIDINYIC